MSIGIFLGVESGRVFFCLTGTIIDKIGWEFLFYFPGAFSVLMAILYYIFMTDDPLENTWISPEEKKLLAECHNREYKPSPAPNDSTTSTSSLGPRLKKYKAQMKFKKPKPEKPMRTPWKHIFCTRMLWLATLQATAQVCQRRNRLALTQTSKVWGSVMMILLVKEYLEEIHGYSLQEAAFIVTIPNNIAQFVLGLCVGSLGDLMIKKEVDVKTVRRVGAGVQILAILPLLILPFLPCEVVSYRATMVVIQVEFSCSSCLWKPFTQVLCSFRVFGNLAGFSSFKDISPTFQVAEEDENRSQLFPVLDLKNISAPPLRPLFHRVLVPARDHHPGHHGHLWHDQDRPVGAAAPPQLRRGDPLQPALHRLHLHGAR